MNLLVLDESLELALLIGRIAPLRGWQPHFIGSLHEMELAVQAHGRPALTVVNLQGPLTAWEVGQRLRGLGVGGDRPGGGVGGGGGARGRRRRRRPWGGCSGWSGRRGRRSWWRRWSGW